MKRKRGKPIVHLPNLTWTAEELGIKKIEKEVKQNDDT